MSEVQILEVLGSNQKSENSRKPIQKKSQSPITNKNENSTQAKNQNEENQSENSTENSESESDSSQEASIGVLTEKPKVLKAKRVPYPASARRAGVAGTVDLEIVIDSQGQVASASVVRGPGFGMNEAALEAIKEFLFSPAKIGEKKVAVRLRYQYVFELGGKL
ncbi:MAG: energy transducer TonB [Pseudobdellovibrionaceae bacterium]